ncbi:MAG: hypothetical protein IJS32_04845 [Kiritimatiellae bacterium]|nr:hypothetical protein [Kiritimatiellia bacterium]
MKTPLDIHTLWLNLYPAPYDYEGELEKLRRYAPDAAFHLWGREATKPLAEEYRPGLWEELFRLARPVMAADILRWLVLWREGGLYWQLGCVPWRPMKAFVPEDPGIECRLWTENVMSPAECQAMASKPIRQGRPEEPIRVANQVFYCRKGAAFAKRMVDFLLERAEKWTPREDYDVLYITANAAVSEAWDRFGKNDPRVELTELSETRQMVRWKHGGMWRRDPRPVVAEAKRPEEPQPFRLLPPNGPRETAKSLVYRFAKRHPHERLLRDGMPWEGEGAVRALQTEGEAFLAERKIKRIVQIPVANSADNRFLNLLYDRVPACDMVLAADWFEWLPYHEIRRIWSQILQSGCRWLAVTTCPLLETQANRGVGDFRPLNFEKAPFLFGKPERTIPFPSPMRRQDRVIGIWDCRKLRERATGSDER